MLIRRASDILREVRQVQSKSARRVNRTFLTNSLSGNMLVDEDFKSRRPKLAEEYAAMQEREREAIRCAGKRIHPAKTVEHIYSTMRNNGLCPQDYTQLFHLLEDVDPCLAVTYKVVFRQDIQAVISDDMWRDAIHCAVAFRIRTTPLRLNSYFPFTEPEWRDFFTLTCSYLLRSPTVEVTKVVTKKQAAKTVVLPVDQKLKDRVGVLEATLAGSEEEHRKQQRALAASYNKAIRAQSMEIARLRAMLPQEAVSELDAEPVPTSELLPLPTTGITFVGASGSAARRLHDKYPDWDYIAEGECPAEYPDNPICFFNTRWISHKQYMHVKRWCPSNLLHCNLVSLDRLEQEMQEAYTSYMRGQPTYEEDA